MKYVLIDKNYDVVDKIDSITEGGAEHYFMKRKQMDDTDKFYSLWKIKTENEHKLNQEAFARKSSSHPTSWWDEDNYLDIDKP